MSAKPSITEIELASNDAIASTGGFKIFNRVLDWITNDRTQLINITDRINEIVRKSGVRDGIVHLQSLHTTTAMSTSCETWCAFSSERCIGIATGLAAGVPAFCAGVESWGCCERTASGWAACDLLMLGTYVRTAAPEPWRWTTLLDSPPSGMEGALT